MREILVRRFVKGVRCRMTKLDELYWKMMEWFQGDAKRIQHFIKVHSIAKQIGEKEKLDQPTLFVLEAAAMIHDIGIKPAQEKYGKCNGKLQEEEGPIAAEPILKELDFALSDIKRILYLIAHHHTYKGIDGIDYQILVEADFLVNFLEDNISKENIRKTCEQIFKTATGIEICKFMYETEQKIQPISETWANDNIQELDDFIESQGIYIRQ